MTDKYAKYNKHGQPCGNGRAPRHMILQRCAEFEYFGLIPPEIAELIKANAEGRLVVLPCKVGAKLYEIVENIKRDRSGYQKVIKERIVDSIGVHKGGHITFSFGITIGSSVTYLGKTVFFTREEAEAALRREEGA